MNMRLFSPQISLEKRLCQEEFANRILAIDEDRDIINDIIQWSLNEIILDNISQSLTNMIYSTLIDSNTSLSTAQHLTKCAILTTRNDTIDKFNEQLFIFMNNEVFTSYSINKVMNEENAKIYTIEY